MEAYQNRVLLEAKELAKKINSLQLFMVKETFHDVDSKEKIRMYRQLNVMSQYLNILNERIDSFLIGKN